MVRDDVRQRDVADEICRHQEDVRRLRIRISYRIRGSSPIFHGNHVQFQRVVPSFLPRAHLGSLSISADRERGAAHVCGDQAFQHAIQERRVGHGKQGRSPLRRLAQWLQRSWNRTGPDHCRHLHPRRTDTEDPAPGTRTKEDRRRRGAEEERIKKTIDALPSRSPRSKSFSFLSRSCDT